MYPKFAFKAAAKQKPSSLGHPRKSFGLLNFCRSSQNIICWAPKFFGFCPSGLLKYLLGNSLGYCFQCMNN